MGDLVIGPATVDDAPVVLDLWSFAGEGTDRHDTADGVARLITRDPGALLLARRSGELVGTLIAGWDGWRCHLYRFAVHPDHRRQGVGRALLAAAEERFTAFGGRRADAMVLAANEIAQPAWAAAGYHPQAEWQRWVKPL